MSTFQVTHYQDTYLTTLHVFKEAEINRSYCDYVHVKDVQMILSQGDWYGKGVQSEERIATAIKTALGINNVIQVAVCSSPKLDKKANLQDVVAKEYWVVYK
ncbi:hypothetical protein C9374_002416 [Naegleria lovaniensis]|uniref:Uncharacterized protein n=1 Tax=Naegleria lovaniensis TaxID=51637 RepID=A0AA88GTC3_NAELO|nr:uncharacterized protein C9374_002416 [Naegleria lovaniensis]KAG2386672.1 hypothetical protein C9374_002416 [Naegleria lovaniensis]